MYDWQVRDPYLLGSGTLLQCPPLAAVVVTHAGLSGEVHHVVLLARENYFNMVQRPLVMSCAIVSWLPPPKHHPFNPRLKWDVVGNSLGLYEIFGLVLGNDMPADSVVDAVLQQDSPVDCVRLIQSYVTAVSLCHTANLQHKHDLAGSSEVQWFSYCLPHLTVIEV